MLLALFPCMTWGVILCCSTRIHVCAQEILEAIEMGGRPGQSQKAIDFERLQKLVPVS